MLDAIGILRWSLSAVVSGFLHEVRLTKRLKIIKTLKIRGIDCSQIKLKSKTLTKFNRI
tara:strand:- start:1481 stop:1657 length:177 start_codon:yes stop_codon:yes gene_type:complete